jgi:hypothetical protein
MMDLKKYPYNSTETDYFSRLSRSIPEQVKIGSKILRIPSLDELGIPAPLQCITHFDRLVSEATWVERGDPLGEFIINYYDPNFKNNIWSKLSGKPDSFSHRFLLLSPSPGLVMDYSGHYCRNNNNLKSQSAASNLGVGLIQRTSMPILLLPEDPIIDEEILIEFSNFLHSSISLNWKRNIHNSGGGNSYKRVALGDISDDHFFGGFSANPPCEILSQIDDASFRKIDTKWPVCDVTYHLNNSERTLFKDVLKAMLDGKYDYQHKVVVRAKLSHL